MNRLSISYDHLNDITVVNYAQTLPDGSEWKQTRYRPNGDFRNDEAVLALMDKNAEAVCQHVIDGCPVRFLQGH